MNPRWFAAGAVAAALAVALGAFAAHGLAGRLPVARLAVWDTAVRYHLFHSIGLVAVAGAAGYWPGWRTEAAGWLFAGGIAVFCGSLYLLALTGAR